MATAIKQRVATLFVKITEHEDAINRLRLEIEIARKRCPHTDRERWTNNDGDGQFTVERCKECGLQRDGGLGE